MNRFNKIGFAKSRFNCKNLLVESKSMLYVVTGLFPLIYLCMRPLSGPHFFRQAQTAWPVRMWSTKGFSLMPMLPTKGERHLTWLLELPLFQYLAFLMHKAFFLSVDKSVRLLGLTFMIGSVFLLIKYFFQLRGKNLKIAMAAAVLNPYMLYWGTTGLIDWLALFVTLLGFLLFLKYRGTHAIPLRIFVTALVILACLVKYPTAFCGALMALGHPDFKYERSKSLLKQTKLIFWIIAISVGTLAVKAYGIFQSSLYPGSDPRHVWDLNSAIYSWDFGTRTQYAQLPMHLMEIYGRLSRTLSTPLVVFLIVVVTIALNPRTIRTILYMLSASLIFVSIFINLNLVHDYYQIPVATIFSTLVGIGIQQIYSSLSKAKLFPAVAILVIPILFTLTMQDQTARTYVKELFSKSYETPGCPAPRMIQNPILQLGNDDPEYFYACNVQGFILQTGEPSDVLAFKEEKSNYHFVYRQPNQSWGEIKQALEGFGGHIQETDDHWAKILWR